MTTDYTPSTEDVRARYHLAGVSDTTPQFLIDMGRKVCYDEFDRWLRAVKAEAWNEALTHVERLSDPASTISIFPERELITLADVTQAREENPYTMENNT